jgi:hypothetical protein
VGLSGIALGPTRISISPSLAADAAIFSEDFFHAQYEIPSAFAIRSFQLVGAAGGVKVGVAEGVDVADAVTEGVGAGSELFEAAGDGVGEGLTLEDGFIATPLFQTSFFPDLMQVYLMFETVFVEFTFVHLVPAIVAEFACRVEVINSALIRAAMIFV